MYLMIGPSGFSPYQGMKVPLTSALFTDRTTVAFPGSVRFDN